MRTTTTRPPLIVVWLVRSVESFSLAPLLEDLAKTIEPMAAKNRDLIAVGG
jgi:hypothetical protein